MIIFCKIRKKMTIHSNPFFFSQKFPLDVIRFGNGIKVFGLWVSDATRSDLEPPNFQNVLRKNAPNP